MEFGKTTAPHLVDFRLPPDPEFNRSLNLKRDGYTKLYLGATGYAMPQWVGSWYPPQTPASLYLTSYSRLLNTLEQNGTYYRMPEANQVRRWAEDVPEDFRFCPKVPQTISHDPQFGRNHTEIGIFCERIALLGRKLGVCFLQLPPKFSLAMLDRLEYFLQYWPKAIPLAVEVRHESYFPKGINTLLTLLHAYGAYTVITDVGGRRDVCHCGLSGDKVLIRLVGNGMVASDLERLGYWRQKFKHWLSLGLSEIYLFCHQPDNLLAPEYCAAAVDAFQGLDHLDLPAKPKKWLPPSEQLTLF